MNNYLSDIIYPIVHFAPLTYFDALNLETFTSSKMHWQNDKNEWNSFAFFFFLSTISINYKTLISSTKHSKYYKLGNDVWTQFVQVDEILK